jgi:hypothetical protein
MHFHAMRRVNFSFVVPAKLGAAERQPGFKTPAEEEDDEAGVYGFPPSRE